MKRDSRFELLRLLSMLFIILSHYSLETHWKTNIEGGLFFQPFGQIGVDLFVMISGYFLSFHPKSVGEMLGKVIRLWVTVLLYSWLMLLVAYIIKPSLINLPRLLRSLFPITLNAYWFMTSFFILMLLVPMLNDFIHKSRITTVILIFLVILFSSGVQSLLPLGFLPFGGSLNLGIMIAAYFFAAILRNFSINIRPVFVISLFIIGLLIEYIGMLCLHHKVFTNGIAPFLSAMAIFYVTVRHNDFHNSVINWFASSVFACYLILCNPFSDMILWNMVLQTEKYSSHPIIPGLLICIVLITITIFIDKIFNLIQRKCFFNILNRLDRYLLRYF